LNIQIFSDLHLEFGDFQIDYSNADIVVLAGDIHVGDNGVKWIVERIPDIPVIYVFGNHEYYGKIYPKLSRTLKQQTQNTNISILENDTIQIEDITFFGCTLWTNFELFGNPRLDGYYCQQNMNDYKKIRREPSYSKIRSIDVAAINKTSTNWIEKEFSKNRGKKNIVITHHAPSSKSLLARNKNKQISSADASNLDFLIDKFAPDFWIHGHLHSSSDYHIGHTRVICNPRGYIDARNKDFIDELIITL
jgi:Icc-related predicted phosphoesterase